MKREIRAFGKAKDETKEKEIKKYKTFILNISKMFLNYLLQNK